MDADGVPESCNIFDGYVPVRTVHPQQDRPPRSNELVEPGFCLLRLCGSASHFVEGERTHIAEHVRNGIGRSHSSIIGKVLKVGLNRCDGFCVEKLPEFGFPKQISEQAAVERKRRSSAFRNRCVVFVHERGDEIEHQ